MYFHRSTESLLLVSLLEREDEEEEEECESSYSARWMRRSNAAFVEGARAAMLRFLRWPRLRQALTPIMCEL